MMAVDTNVLVAAVVPGHPHHGPASTRLVALAEAGEPWGLPAPVVAEFTRVLTHPRVYGVDRRVAAQALRQILGLRGAVLLVPTAAFGGTYCALIEAGLADGNAAFDAQIAAICLDAHATLVTADRGFSRFAGLSVALLA